MEWSRIYRQPLPENELDDCEPDPGNAVIQCLITEVFRLREELAGKGATFQERMRSVLLAANAKAARHRNNKLTEKQRRKEQKERNRLLRIVDSKPSSKDNPFLQTRKLKIKSYAELNKLWN